MFNKRAVRTSCISNFSSYESLAISYILEKMITYYSIDSTFSMWELKKYQMPGEVPGESLLNSVMCSFVHCIFATRTGHSLREMITLFLINFLLHDFFDMRDDGLVYQTRIYLDQINIHADGRGLYTFIWNVFHKMQLNIHKLYATILL